MFVLATAAAAVAAVLMNARRDWSPADGLDWLLDIETIHLIIRDSKMSA